jgi:hypothetical protein
MTEFVAFPREVIIGSLDRAAAVDDVEHALHAVGFDDGDIRFLDGPDGLGTLEGRTRWQRAVRSIERLANEGEHLTHAVEALKDGHVIVAVQHVRRGQDIPARQALAAAGVTGLHYFGRWTFD